MLFEKLSNWWKKRHAPPDPEETAKILAELQAQLDEAKRRYAEKEEKNLDQND